MSKLHWSLLIVYLTAAAGYGGWRGQDLWSDWGVWCLLLPLLAWEAQKLLGRWRLKPDWASLKFWLVMSVIEVVALGGFALLLAWWFAWATAKWSVEPAVHAVGGALVAAMILTLAAYNTSRPAKAQETKGPEDTGTPAEPGA